MSLARAREQSVLAAWSGLGYYRRARNLHAAAKVVAFERGGEFPRTAEGLRELPGIGRYTAAAIASIAFGERAAVVDGNVERVLQRLTGEPEMAKSAMWGIAETLLSPLRPADFNQAMMELGAMVCSPREPKCLTCPVIEFCETRGAQARRKSKEVRKTETIGFALSRQNGSVRLVQRAKDAPLMAGMWELPSCEVDDREVAARFRHSILDADFEVSVYESDAAGEGGRWVGKNRLPRLALTGLSRKILRHFKLL